jgi:hypothetical protein
VPNKFQFENNSKNVLYSSSQAIIFINKILKTHPNIGVSPKQRAPHVILAETTTTNRSLVNKNTSTPNMNH